MNVQQLLSLNIYDELRFYEETDIDDPYSIDEYTPYKPSIQVNFNREVKYFFMSIEGSNGEIEDCWISIILKEKNDA